MPLLREAKRLDTSDLFQTDLPRPGSQKWVQPASNSVKETSAFDLDYHLTTLTDSGTARVQELVYGYDQSKQRRFHLGQCHAC